MTNPEDITCIYSLRMGKDEGRGKMDRVRVTSPEDITCIDSLRMGKG